MKLTRLAAVAALTAACAFPVHADTIVPSEWAKTFTITFSGYSGSETLTDFPALVRLSTGITGFSYDDFLVRDGNDVPTGADLRFADITGNILDYEIDTWNPEGESLVWVKVPSLSSSTWINCYYGKAGAVSASSGSAVWGGYVGVWHMNVDSSLGTSNIVDSTGHRLNGLTYNSGVQHVDGVLGKSFHNLNQGSNGGKQNDSRVELPNYNDYIPNASTFTVSGWFKHDNANYAAGRRLFCHKANNTIASGWEVYMNEAGTNKIHLRGNNTSGHLVLSGVPYKENDELKWFHVVAVYRGNYVDVYANGVRISAEGGTSFGGTITATENDSALGVLNYGSGGAAAMKGWTDEVRISGSTFSADRAVAEYQTMAPNSSFAVYGTAAAPVVSGDPVVVTGVASGLARHGFTVAGVVSSFGSDGNSGMLYVDYGTDESNLTSLAGVEVDSLGVVNRTIEGLLPGTAYVYRFRLVVGEKTAAGAFASATTLSGAAVFGEPSATATHNSITASVALTELAADDGDGTVVSLYVSEDHDNWGEAVHEFAPATDTDGTFEWTTDSPLKIDTRYYYAFKAVGTYGGQQYESWSEVADVRTVGKASVELPPAVTVDASATLRAVVTPSCGATTVELLYGASSENLETVKTWTDISASAELSFDVAVSAPVRYFYKFRATTFFTEEGGSSQQTAVSESPVAEGGIATWTGGAGTTDWNTAENWDIGVVPSGSAFFARIDNNAEKASVVTNLVASGMRNWTNSVVSVDSGDSVTLAHGKWDGDASYRIGEVRNRGELTILGGANTTSGSTMAFYDSGAGNVFNAEGATLFIHGRQAPNAAGQETIYRMNATNQNDGTIIVQQERNNNAYARLQFDSVGGAFTNNGEIILRKVSDTAVSGYASLLFDPGVHGKEYSLLGSGRLMLDLSQSLYGTNANERSILVHQGERQRHKLVNGAEHTIEGAGYIKDLGIDNYGIIRAFDVPRRPIVVVDETTGEETSRTEVLPCPLQIRCYYHGNQSNQYGARIDNRKGAAMIAMESSGGLLLGNAEHTSTFVNAGLLEARTGSMVMIRSGCTESTTKNTAAAQVELGGVIAGGGSIVTYRPAEFKSVCVVKPGNLALNDDGEDDGLGESLVGTLSFTTNVTFKAGSSLEIQGDSGAVDAIAVAGSVTIESGAKLKVMGRLPSGTHHLIASAQPITGDFDLECVDGAPKVALSKSSVTVGEGDETVTTYYLDGTCQNGLAVIIR